MKKKYFFFFLLSLFTFNWLACEKEEDAKKEIDNQEEPIPLFLGVVMDTTIHEDEISAIGDNSLEKLVKLYLDPLNIEKIKFISDATITVEGGAFGRFTVDLENGYYRYINQVAFGEEYKVSVSHEDYHPETLSIIIEEKLVIDMEPGEKNHGFTILRPYVPELSVSEDTLFLGTEKESAILSIENTGEGRLKWSFKDNTEKVQIVLPENTTTLSGKKDFLTVRIDRAKLPLGKYAESFKITSNGGEKEIAIVFTVVRDYSVVFDAKGGTPTPQHQTVKTFQHASEPSVEPVLTGKKFKGWYTIKNTDTTLFNFKQTEITDETVLYALYSEEPKNTAPTAPSLSAPTDQTSGVSVDAELQWNASTDADGDALQYTVYLDENTSPSTAVSTDQS